MTKIIFASLILPLFISCTKEANQPDELPVIGSYKYVNHLQEMAVKFDSSEWQPIKDGKGILFFSDQPSLAPTVKGKFVTTGTLQYLMMIATDGFFVFDNNQLMLSSRNGETLSLHYENVDANYFILTYHSASATLSVKFRRL